MKTRPSPFLSNPSVTNRKFHWRHSIFEYPAISSSTCLFRSLTVSIKIITELFDRRRKRIIGEQPAIGFIDRFIFSSYSFSTWILDRRKIFHPVVIFCSPLDWLQEEWGGNWLSIDLSFFFLFYLVDSLSRVPYLSLSRHLCPRGIPFILDVRRIKS